jgi:hypothetical protein
MGKVRSDRLRNHSTDTMEDANSSELCRLFMLYLSNTLNNATAQLGKSANSKHIKMAIIVDIIGVTPNAVKLADIQGIKAHIYTAIKKK